MIKVVVVDDHAVVREGLKRIISEAPNMMVSGEASSGNEAIDVVRKTPCDAVLLDITMPDRNGMDVLKQIHTDNPRLPVLVLQLPPHCKAASRTAGYASAPAGYETVTAQP